MRHRADIGAWVFAAVLLGACAAGSPPSHPPPGQCPQPRFTGRAPEAIYRTATRLEADTANIEAGHRLYENGANPSCSTCHGIRGDGQGPLASQFDPPPRNFACAETVNGIPDGQLYWVIRNGSPGTSMPAFDALADRQVWQLVLYLRELAR